MQAFHCISECLNVNCTGDWLQQRSVNKAFRKQLLILAGTGRRFRWLKWQIPPAEGHISCHYLTLIPLITCDGGPKTKLGCYWVSASSCLCSAKDWLERKRSITVLHHCTTASGLHVFVVPTTLRTSSPKLITFRSHNLTIKLSLILYL